MNEKQYVQYTVAVPGAEQQELLIAMMDDFGFSGFEQQETGFSANAIQGTIDEPAVETWLNEQGVPFSKKYIAEENWNAQWEQSFEPIVIGNFCAVRASFHPPVTGVEHEIVITPKMSFGTGHHATTYMMMQAMQEIPFSGMEVIDFGTGTGILAILAEKMGAAKVVAIDYDPWCIENGAENIASNQCSNIALQQAADLNHTEPVQILLANINKNIIIQNMDAMYEKLHAGGLMLLSGLLEADEAEIIQTAVGKGFRHRQKYLKSGWICLLFEKP